MTHPRTIIALVALFVSWSTVRASDLAADLDALLEKSGLSASSRIGVSVRRLADGAVLYEHDAGDLFVPASNQKLVTTACALSRLGPNHELSTVLFLRGRVEGGALEGDVVIRGAGDPGFSERGGGALAVLAQWARDVRSLGIERILGDVVADDRLFDRERIHPEWPQDQLDRWYCAPVSPLLLNDACFDVEVALSDGAPRVTVHPACGLLRIENLLELTERKKAHLIVYRRSAGGDLVRVTGRFWRGAGPFQSPVAMGDPALVFAYVFSDLLEQAGVRILGKARLAGPKEPASATDAFRSHGVPVGEAIGVVNARSHNLHAEVLLKLLGTSVAGEGSWAAGGRVVRTFLDEEGIPARAWVLSDGSGLSRENRLSPGGLARLLCKMSRSPHAALYESSLARPGGEGTLRNRLAGLGLETRLAAKTGTIRGASSLSGYLRPEKKDALAFVILINGGFSSARARRLQDDLVRELAGIR